MKILLVDDQVLFREALAHVLSTTADCEVVGQAGSVHEAIALNRELQPGIILMDFSLPDGTGLDATRGILAESPGAKIVFLTVHENTEGLLAAIRLGARGYLIKDTGLAMMITYLRGVDRGEVALSPSVAGQLFAQVARQPAPLESQASMPDGLTSREREVLGELAAGASNREIATHLTIAENTAKNHVRAILLKLGVHSRRDAAAAARSNKV